MSRTISTTELAAGIQQTIENRTRRTCIEATVDGRYQLIAERETVTRINGAMVGAPGDGGTVVLTHEQLTADPKFAVVQQAIAAAIDAAEAAREAAAAQGAAAAAEA